MHAARVTRAVPATPRLSPARNAACVALRRVASSHDVVMLRMMDACHVDTTEPVAAAHLRGHGQRDFVPTRRNATDQRKRRCLSSAPSTICTCCPSASLRCASTGKRPAKRCAALGSSNEDTEQPNCEVRSPNGLTRDVCRLAQMPRHLRDFIALPMLCAKADAPAAPARLRSAATSPTRPAVPASGCVRPVLRA